MRRPSSSHNETLFYRNISSKACFIYCAVSLYSNKSKTCQKGLLLVHKTYISQTHWLTVSATPSLWQEVSVLNGSSGSWWWWLRSHGHAHLINLPATGVFPKLVDEPPAVHPLQNLPLVIIPVGKSSQSAEHLHSPRWLSESCWWIIHSFSLNKPCLELTFYQLVAVTWLEGVEWWRCFWFRFWSVMVPELTSWPGSASRRSCCCSSSSVPTSGPRPQIWGTWRPPPGGPPTSSGPGSSLGGSGCPGWIPRGGFLEELQAVKVQLSVCMWWPRQCWDNAYRVCSSWDRHRGCCHGLCWLLEVVLLVASVWTRRLLSWHALLGTKRVTVTHNPQPCWTSRLQIYLLEMWGYENSGSDSLLPDSGELM